MFKLLVTLPKGWQKMKTVLSAEKCAELIALTGDPDYMIVDRFSVGVKGIPATMEGIQGIFSENSLPIFHIDVAEYPEGTILKFIKDDDIHFGTVVQHEGRTGVFLALANHTYINTESYREGEVQGFKAYFVLIGEKNVLHDYKGFIAELGASTQPTTTEKKKVAETATNLTIKKAGEVTYSEPLEVESLIEKGIAIPNYKGEINNSVNKE